MLVKDCTLCGQQFPNFRILYVGYQSMSASEQLLPLLVEVCDSVQWVLKRNADLVGWVVGQPHEVRQLGTSCQLLPRLLDGWALVGCTVARMRLQMLQGLRVDLPFWIPASLYEQIQHRGCHDLGFVLIMNFQLLFSDGPTYSVDKCLQMFRATWRSIVWL